MSTEFRPTAPGSPATGSPATGPRVPGPRPPGPAADASAAGPPAVVRTAWALWLTAVGAGVFETVLMVGRSPDDAGAGLLFRFAVFTVAVLVAFRMRSGARWARIALAVGLGVLGTASLVVQPIGYLLDGGGLGDALGRADSLDLVFGASRILHLTAVLTALLLMFRPAANAYFRARR
ncbi:hypothetical protein [Streptomyces sp. NPDC057939]|uniref:hypothetical protein n=1 Tax=Streptomyces sp. NPDC057939 TaxID=3346284 RepID=UPI0036E3AF32